MLIGKFANKFNVSTDTIRYYMDLGLLLPEKRNHYYEFDETCAEEMKWIQELKELRFTLQEINKILAIKRVTSLEYEEDKKYIINMFEDKKQSLQQEMEEIKKASAEIEEKISSLITTSWKKSESNGMDATFLSILSCPLCQELLELEEAKIKGKQIFEGKLHCSNCAYNAKINDGILITKHLNQHSFNPFYIYDIEMLKTVQSSFINLSEKANMYVKKILLEHPLNEKVILETNIDTYVFLEKYIADLNTEATYIFTGSTLPMLKMTKEKIEKKNPHLSVLYVLNSGLDLPFKHGLIDYFIDSYSFNEFSLFHQTLPMKSLKHYLHKNSVLIGCYFQYENKAETLSEMKKLHPTANPDNLKANYIQENLNAGDFHIIEKYFVGETMEPGKYIKYHTSGDTARFYVYQAINDSV